MLHVYKCIFTVVHTHTRLALSFVKNQYNYVLCIMLSKAAHLLTNNTYVYHYCALSNSVEPARHV